MTGSHLQVMRGEASPEDVAALLIVFGDAQAQARTDQPTAIHAWNSRERLLRTFPIVDPGAWRESGLAQ